MDIFDRARGYAAGAIGVMVVALAVFPDAAGAQGVIKSVHGDWQVRCDTPPGAQNEQCALIQSVTAEDRPNVGLTVIVLKTADQKYRLMRVLAPLGVLLPSGLGLIIDSELNEPNPLQVQRTSVAKNGLPTVVATIALSKDPRVIGGIVKGDSLLYCHPPAATNCAAAPKTATVGNVNGRTIELEADPTGVDQMRMIGHRRQVGRAGFVRCLPNGCVAEVIMDESLIKELRSGQMATFTIFQTPEEGIGIPLNLKGFGEGLDKLP